MIKQYNFKIGDTVIYEGKEAVVTDLIDEITVEVEIDKPTCYLVPKNTFLNRIYAFLGWRLDLEITNTTYKGLIECSFYKLKAI